MDTTFYTIHIFSENVAGVLNQVTNVFTRRQLNIESIDAFPSGIENVHRYTITCRTEQPVIDLVCRQIEKKIDVLVARYYGPDERNAFNKAFADLMEFLDKRSEQEKLIKEKN